MTVQELKDEIAKGDKVKLLDVRERDEYEGGDKI
jgi:rhodanese-related sulfurtransferase